MPDTIGLTQDLSESSLDDTLVKRNPVAANLVLDYPLRCDLLDEAGGSDASFSRSTAATYSNVTSGLEDTAAINEPRFEPEGILKENATVQRITHSSDLSNAVWTAAASNVETPVQDGTLGPDGVTQAWKVEASTAAAAYIAFVDGGGNLSNAKSVWALAGNTDRASILSLASSVTGTGQVNATLSSTEWTEIKQANTSASNALVLAVGFNTIAGNPAAGDYVYFWQPQLETAPVPTSWNTTSGSTYSRAFDLITLPVSNLPANNAAQSIAFDFYIHGDAGYSQTLFTITGETNPRKALVNTSEQLVCGFGSNTVTSGASAVSFNTMHRCVIRSDTSDFEAFIDGTSIGTAAIASVSGTPTAISVGGGFMNIRDFRVYNKYLSDAELKYA